MIEKVVEYLDSELNGLQGRKIAVLGVSYTPKAWSTTMEFMNEYILGER